MKLFSKLLFTLSLILVAMSAFAQRSISGVITSDIGEPLTGAAVIVKGTTLGTVTDLDGKFTLNNVPAEAQKVVISYTGYIAQESDITNAPMAISLKEGMELTNVVVVGSRSTTVRTRTETAAPVDVISAKELKAFSQVDLGQILNYVAPSFNSNRQTVADGTDHLDPAALRGLGPDQVLVLVNGKRRHTSALVNINGTVGRGAVGTDMNVIPVAAVERIEVLRDGAAAQYGSDAIAGVINVVLKKNYQGLTASLNTGMNVTNLKYNIPVLGSTTPKAVSQSLTDGQVAQFDISKGFRLGKEGSFTVSAQYNQRGSTNRSGIDNAPTIYLGGNGSFPGTPAGQVQDAFRTKLLAEDAAIVAANKYDRHNMVFGNSTSKNMGMFLNGILPINEGSEVYFAGGVTYRTGLGFGNNRIPVSRAQQPLKADGSLYYPNGFLPGIASTINDQSLIAGYKTTFGDWTADLSNTIGQNAFRFGVEQSGNASMPSSDTQQSTFDAGTLKFLQNTTNLDLAKKFENTGNIKDLNLAVGAEYRFENYQINAGEAASYSGGEVGKLKTVPTAPLTTGGAAAGTTLAGPGSQVFPGFQPSDATNKTRSSVGLYADVEGEVASRVLLGAAARFENFSDFGSNVSGKISSRIKITDHFAVRGSASTGFRAPSLHQRYFQNTSTQFVSGIPSNTLTVNNDNPIARSFIGVDALKPETSISYTAGVTASAGEFSLTADLYQITIKDRIVYSGAFSRGLLGFSATEYVGVNNVNFFANAANTSTKGLDIVVNYRTRFNDKNRLLASVALNFNQNDVTAVNYTKLIGDATKNDPTKSPDTWFKNLIFDRQQQSRIEVWQPKNKVNASLTYTMDKFDITVRAVRFGEVQYVHNADTEAKKADGTFWNTQFARNASSKALIDQTFAAVTIADLTLGYRFTDNFTLNIGANNIFDVYPDQIFIDPRNAAGSLDYTSGRDASNRGRLLFQPNQGGYNGRHIFARLAATF
jgi:iron complex outermembrane recepter protein